MPFLHPQEQLERLKDAVQPIEIIGEDELLGKLERSAAENRPLIVKQGFDASAPDLHLGHAVSLWKLRAFQDLGHRVIFLIGDFTAMIGDPSGKSKTRPRLSREQVLSNAQTYRDQVFGILDPDRTEVLFNSQWLAAMSFGDFLDLASRHTVHRMLERDDFAKRFNAEDPISLMEFCYPLAQAYDSVALKADVELGGSDQKFNLVLTRHIQRSYGQEPEVLMLMPLLRGTDGREKMSKSLGNYIGINEPPDEMYGKVMSIGDDLLKEYYLLASGLKAAEALAAVDGDPYQAKHHLARLITSRYHGLSAADAAAARFIARFKQRRLPTMDELKGQGKYIHYPKEIEWLPRLLTETKLTGSNSEALRLIKAGAVEVDGERVQSGSDMEINLSTARILKVGKVKILAVEFSPKTK